jgi:peroxidase
MGTTTGAVVGLCLMAMVVMATGLTTTHYDRSCPQLQSIVKAEVQRAVKAEKRMAASLIRLHFHDCFVNGCDGSILLDNTTTFVSEKFAFGNVNSVRGFDVIDRIKTTLEKVCPRTVSCADIVAIAYRDSAVEVGLTPSYALPLGRLDSLSADINEANRRLPPASANYSALVRNFAFQGLDETDLIALSGAHTIGRVRCGPIRGSGVLNDPTTNAEFRKKLEGICPAGGNAAVLTDLDYKTPDKFDNNYYKNLRRGEGVILSDQTLQSTRGRNQDIVKDFAENQENFFAQFGKSSIKMGNIAPAPGTPRGQIRRNCHFVNPQSLIELE